jgi:hypothetical protein
MKSIFVIFILFVIGCEIDKPPLELKAKVTDVRILLQPETKNNEDDTIPGAIVGGLVAGKTGAIVGAIAGKENDKSTIVYKIEGCQFNVEVDNMQMTFRAWGDHIQVCSMLKENDIIRIKKYKDGYCWSEAVGISPGCVMGQ